MNPFFEFPKLADGALVAYGAETASISLGKRKLDLRNQGGINPMLTELLQALQAGVTPTAQYHSRFETANIDDVIHGLDTAGLLVEAGPPGVDGRTGKCVITRLEQEHRLRGEQAPWSPLWTVLGEGRASRALLTGLAFEYYFLTTAAYDAIAPAVSKLFGEQKLIMMNFLLGEYRHDKLMIKSLYACGISDADVAAASPHPYTRALTDMLGYWAESDPLAFMASLFILEGTDDGGKRYLELLQRNDLPDGYLTGIIEHDRANSDENHGAISRELFSSIEFISEVEQERISAKLSQMHHLMLRRYDELVRYYDDPQSRFPRIFA